LNTSDETKGRFNRRAIKVPEAQLRILQHTAPLNDETVPLTLAFQRSLYESIQATEDVPHFARSGMDGYAVRSDDAKESSVDDPSILHVIDRVAAGEVSNKVVAEGTAIRIMTGAAIPEGADAVVMLEQTDSYVRDSHSLVGVKHPVLSGQNIAKPGDEIPKGRLLIEKGTSIQPGQIALLATFGYSQVKVFRKPKVGVFATGSELLPVNAPLVKGKIRNSNSYMISAQVMSYGGEVHNYGTIPDEVNVARQMIRHAFEEMDVIITSGGVSVGDYDIMVDLFQDQGHELLFNKVAMRPGSPTTVSMVNGKFLFGLSGNPGACFVGCELFVRPALLALQGNKEPIPAPIEAEIVEEYPKGSPHERYERSRLIYQDGRVYVKPLRDKSSMMVSIQHTDGLMIIPPGKKGISKGTKVKVIPLSYTKW
jgi:molybdopterin molybdotransferase